jgi:hypothetical protein
MIGDQSVLIPRLQNDTMRQILALFQGKASFGVPAGEQEGETVESAPAFMGVAYVAAPANTETSPTTTIPVVAPEQDTIGFVPPNDPSCR